MTKQDEEEDDESREFVTPEEIQQRVREMAEQEEV